MTPTPNTGGTPSTNTVSYQILHDLTRNRTIPPIYTLGDDILLKVFCNCRPVLFGDDEADDDRSIEVKKWDRERWWYNLARVCQKWRYLILESASYLHICLFCSYGTSVADMLMHSPPLPLVIDYSDEDRDVTAQDEECISLALQCHLRVRRIRLWMSVSSLRRLLTALDGEFPMLESLYIKPLTNDDNFNCLSLPDTFNAPHLRHFALKNVIYSPGAPGPPFPIPYVSSTKRISESPPHHGPQMWRYALRLCLSAVNECGPRTTEYRGFLSTFLTMIRFSTYFISAFQLW